MSGPKLYTNMEIWRSGTKKWTVKYIHKHFTPDGDRVHEEDIIDNKEIIQIFEKEGEIKALWELNTKEYNNLVIVIEEQQNIYTNYYFYMLNVTLTQNKSLCDPNHTY